jgi:uncharacterized membrane protein
MRWQQGVKVLTSGFVWPLAMLTLVSIGFFIVGAIENHSRVFWYLMWNLFLAWLPLVFALWLLPVIRRFGWTSWPGIILTLLWLNFLPNSFYMVSDFIHLQDYQRVDVVFDAVMFALFVLTGLLIGFSSLYLIHIELIKRLKKRNAWCWIGAILVICSFAIYLGRDLRMNSWDILTNPAGILFDITDPIVNPKAHGLAFTTTLTFSIFLISLYVVVWQLVSAIARHGDAHLLYTGKR